MADDRRYRESEIAEIFEAASAPGDAISPAGSSEGLTLSELQDIGREVGIAPDRIAAAAAQLVPVPYRGPAKQSTVLGLPRSAGLSVDLPRAPTDREWDLIVTDLRETFGAIGRERSDRSSRQWWNGNLHALIEPTASGNRLRLGTVKGDAVVVTGIGIGGIVMAMVVFLASVLGGDATDLVGALAIALMGAGALGFNALRLPRWARERQLQMESIAERTLALIGPGTEPSPE